MCIRDRDTNIDLEDVNIETHDLKTDDETDSIDEDDAEK